MRRVSRSNWSDCFEAMVLKSLREESTKMRLITESASSAPTSQRIVPPVVEGAGTAGGACTYTTWGVLGVAAGVAGAALWAGSFKPNIACPGPGVLSAIQTPVSRIRNHAAHLSGEPTLPKTLTLKIRFQSHN